MAKLFLHVSCMVIVVAALQVRVHAQTAPGDIMHERAQSSLVMPASILAAGLTLIVAAPIVSLTMMSTSWRHHGGSCSEDFCSGNDSAALGAGIGFTLVGSALTAFGITRVVQIRSARRRLAVLDDAGLSAGPGSARLSLRLRF